MTRHQWLMIMVSFYLSDVYCQRILGDSSQSRIAKSAVEHLRDRGTYIIHFKSTVTEIEQQHFAAVLETKSKTTKRFVVEIIEKLFTINCLTAKLSKKASHWV